MDYWAEWCGPCSQVAPVLEEIASEHGEKIDVVKLNVDDNPQPAREVRHYDHPDDERLHRCEVVKQIVGAKSKSALLRDLADFI